MNMEQGSTNSLPHTLTLCCFSNSSNSCWRCFPERNTWNLGSRWR